MFFFHPDNFSRTRAELFSSAKSLCVKTKCLFYAPPPEAFFVRHARFSRTRNTLSTAFFPRANVLPDSFPDKPRPDGFLPRAENIRGLHIRKQTFFFFYNLRDRFLP